MSISGIDNSGNNYDFYIREDHDLINASIKYGNNPYGIPALHYAIMQGDEKAVRLFLDHGASPDSQTPPPTYHAPTTALEYAAQYGQLNIARLLLERGANLNQNRELHDGQSYIIDPLRWAAMANHPELIRLLIEHGATISYNNWESPIYAAVESGSVDALKALVNSGVKLNHPELTKTFNPLQAAIRSGKLDMVKFLVSMGADINARTQDTREPLVFGAVEWPSILQFLINKGANIHIPFDGGNTILHYAAGRGTSETIDILVQAGSPINAKNSLGQTPLHANAPFSGTPKNGDKTLIALLKNKADINIKDNRGYKPAQSYMHNHFMTIEMLKLFVKMGVNVNEQDPSGYTLLETAIITNINPWHKNDAIIAFLINDTHANVNHQNQNGAPLLYAAELGDSITMELLLKKGADINIKINERSALSIVKNRHQELVEWLIARGAR